MSKTLHEEVAAAYEASLANSEPVEEREIIEDVSEAVDEVEHEIAEESEEDSHVEEAEDEIEAPEHWASEDKDVFKSLDKRGKDFLLRRHKEMEAGFTKKQQALAEEARVAESYRKTLTPHEQYLKGLNIDPLQAFDKLMQAEKILRTGTKEQKALMMHNLAHQYQADMSTPIDPTQYQNQIILQELQQLKQQQNMLREQKEEEINHSYRSQVDSFAKAKDDKGAHKYPHFEEIRQDMGLLMSAGKAETLEEAYEQAILLNTRLRKEYIAKQYRVETDAKKVSASKRAAFNVKSGSGGTIVDPTKQLSLRETIQQALEAQSRR